MLLTHSINDKYVSLQNPWNCPLTIKETTFAELLSSCRLILKTKNGERQGEMTSHMIKMRTEK